MIQRHEIEAWLGDDHGLTDEQVDELTATAEDIADRYPDHDDQEERDAALTAAYRILAGDTDDLVDDLARDLSAARVAESKALAGLRQAAVMLVGSKVESQAGFARRAGVDRMAVRDWLGLRKDRTVILFESNGPAVFLGRGGQVWDLGPVTGDLVGRFAEDAQAWIDGDWEPNEVDGQTKTAADGLTAVAEWTKAGGVRLLVDVERLGGAAETYLGEHAAD